MGSVLTGPPCQNDSAGNYIGAAGVAFPPAGSAPEVTLQPFDHVTVFPQPKFALQRTLALSAEERR